MSGVGSSVGRIVHKVIRNPYFFSLPAPQFSVLGFLFLIQNVQDPVVMAFQPARDKEEMKKTKHPLLKDIKVDTILSVSSYGPELSHMTKLS